MQTDSSVLLAGWQSFYVILGSSAAALTGLNFVVVTLIPDTSLRTSSDGIDAYSTPTVVHFCAALLISALLCAPWPALTGVGAAVGMVGAVGIVYVALVTRRARRQTEYRPVFEDWLWHTILPFLAYVTQTIAGITLCLGRAGALYGIATAAMLLLFIGIHNSWDTVTFLALKRTPRGGRGPESP
ncbi:MAG TPA: hypothetical protein VHW65_08075 [Gemmatimonadales bacterium]|jgi:hypothetical protein|nr:hypothetical protein [Gemmatimonadales bacterium]